MRLCELAFPHPSTKPAPDVDLWPSTQNDVNFVEKSAEAVDSGVRHVCGKHLGKNVNAHLFNVHGFTKDEIKHLQAIKRRRVLAITCPLCSLSLSNHHELVLHVDVTHAERKGTYRIENAFFENKSSFLAWKHELEEGHTMRYAVHSKKKGTTYMRCSRALSGPSYVEKCTNLKKTTQYCTAFMNVTEREESVDVEFCRQHCGHEIEAALLTLSSDNEKQILSYLKDGFSYKQVINKIRELCRSTGSLSSRFYYTTLRNIRRVAIKNNMDPARRHQNDITSLELRVAERKPEDGIKHYAPASDPCGNDFALVIVTPMQKSWLELYARRALCMDDTYNLTPCALRLATVIAPDGWDMGLPAAYLLSYRMTENKIQLLFQEIVKLLPYFDTKYFVSDNANCFYNGFLKVFPQSTAKKLLCKFHVLQNVKRYCKNLKKTSLTPMIVSKMAELCRTRDIETFERKYALLLLQLRENGEDAIVQYFERNWSPRMSEWGGYGRDKSSVNTFMLIERFHRRIKHEFIQTKSSVRVDSLVDLLINIVPTMEEDRRIKMARGLREGRHRLYEQHRRHNNGIKLFCDGGVTSEVEGVGKWLIHEKERMYRVEETSCDCDKILNNHCYKCSACGYAFRCSCLDDSTAEVTCTHVHIALTYSGQGRRECERQDSSDCMPEVATIPALEIPEPEVETLTDAGVETPISPEQASEAGAENASMSTMEIADKCKELTQTFNAEMASIRVKVLAMLNNTDDGTLAQLMLIKDQLQQISCNIRYEKNTLARRLDASATGRIPKFRGIRLVRRAALRYKRRAQRNP